jgi:hypothetical protein
MEELGMSQVLSYDNEQIIVEGISKYIFKHFVEKNLKKSKK